MNLFGIVRVALNEPQAGIDHRQEASEVMGYAASHFTDCRETMRRTFALHRSDPGVKMRVRRQ
ncbi:hypothetical protein ACTDI4_22305 [Mesorhizobium sp. PUT5]|uniref:hypothetical protein n=1 Tax=Mesorhizobium sp. PUT5 TaxID=3454629 RepID=UPI003FA40954